MMYTFIELTKNYTFHSVMYEKVCHHEIRIIFECETIHALKR